MHINIQVVYDVNVGVNEYKGEEGWFSQKRAM